MGLPPAGTKVQLRMKISPLPCAAIVRAQIDKVLSAYSGVLDGESSAADGIYSLMSQRRVSDGGIGNPHMGIEPGKDAAVV